MIAVEKKSIAQDILKLFNNVRERTRPLSPVEWAELKRSLPSSVSAKAGRVDYNWSPYLKEIVNHFDPRSNTSEIAVMKGAQLGFSQLVLETVIGYTIDVYPRSILFLSADKGLAEEAIETRIDAMLVSTGLHHKLKPSSGKKNNRATGDTKGKKEFIGGILYARGGSSANKMRAISVPILLYDEIDGVKSNVRNQGSPSYLAKSRTSAFESFRKIFYGSTPLLADTSNIYPLYLQGDRRKWHVPCPHCGEMQEILWNGENFNDEKSIRQKEKNHNAGIKYETTKDNILIKDSVHYECVNGCKIYENEKFFMNLKGKWIATHKSHKKGFVSYHINSLISNFSSWYEIISEFLHAKNDKDALQVWVNNRLGEVWKDKPKIIDVTKLNSNVKKYIAGTIPNKLALSHGNSRIVALIATCDVNGDQNFKEGWLAFEIKGFCGGGQSYSIAKAEIHGDTSANGNVWQALSHIMENAIFYSDDDLEYKINVLFCDSGARTNEVYNFTNKYERAFAVKGSGKKNTYRFRKSKQERAKLYNLSVNIYKDDLANYLTLNHNDTLSQPPYYMNFPANENIGGLENLNLEKFGVVLAGTGYNKKYFSTFASEVKKEEIDKLTGEVLPTGLWEKVHSRSYNHFWDCNVYAFAGLDIYCNMLGENELEIKNSSRDSVLKILAEDMVECNEQYL